MNALRAWLLSYRNYLTATPAEVLAALTADGTPIVSHERWTYAGLAQRFGLEVVGQIDEVLKSLPGMDWVRLSLAAQGLDFADSETQRGITQLVNSQLLSAETGDQLKAIGLKPRTVWQEWAGMDSTLPSEAEIVETQQQVNDELSRESMRMAARDWVSTLINEVLRPLAESGASVAEIKAAVAQHGD